MKYTEFGQYFKILRIKHQEVLNDAKSFLNVSSAFISAVECGKKPIPSDWYGKIVAHYKLNKKEQEELQTAINNSAKSIKIDITNASPEVKNLALQFQRSFENLDEETANEILKIFERNHYGL